MLLIVIIINNNIAIKAGPLYSSDTFYDDTTPAIEWRKAGSLAVEMEAAALYMTAQRFGMRAIAVCTISDLVYPPFDSLDSEAREKTFTDMMTLALETAVISEGLPHLEPKE